jgi:hypothetical protein
MRLVHNRDTKVVPEPTAAYTHGAQSSNGRAKQPRYKTPGDKERGATRRIAEGEEAARRALAQEEKLLVDHSAETPELGPPLKPSGIAGNT